MTSKPDHEAEGESVVEIAPIMSVAPVVPVAPVVSGPPADPAPDAMAALDDIRFRVDHDGFEITTTGGAPLNLAHAPKRTLHPADGMIARTLESVSGGQVNPNVQDKYETPRAAVIDCASRMHLCKAACCKLSFHLSAQDVREGVVRWDWRRPYHIATAPSGYCVHCEPETRRCNIHEKRPIVCREYDCRKDARIWVDFDNGIPNPDL